MLIRPITDDCTHLPLRVPLESGRYFLEEARFESDVVVDKRDEFGIRSLDPDVPLNRGASTVSDVAAWEWKVRDQIGHGVFRCLLVRGRSIHDDNGRGKPGLLTEVLQ
jgi:hypothetical protein